MPRYVISRDGSVLHNAQLQYMEEHLFNQGINFKIEALILTSFRHLTFVQKVTRRRFNYID